MNGEILVLTWSKKIKTFRFYARKLKFATHLYIGKKLRLSEFGRNRLKNIEVMHFTVRSKKVASGDLRRLQRYGSERSRKCLNRLRLDGNNCNYPAGLRPIAHIERILCAVKVGL